jgi:hypothetical protein
MTCLSHRWSEVGHVGPTISVECQECGSSAVVDRDGAVIAGPFVEIDLFGNPPAGQLRLFEPGPIDPEVTRVGIALVRAQLARHSRHLVGAR